MLHRLTASSLTESWDIRSLRRSNWSEEAINIYDVFLIADAEQYLTLGMNDYPLALLELGWFVLLIVIAFRDMCSPILTVT